MRIIPLTQGKVTIVDDSDWEFLSQFKWHYSKRGYARTIFNGKHRPMHRLFFSTLPGFLPDHENRNKLDNRRSNIRVITRSGNIANQDRPIAKSGFVGVHRQTQAPNRWRAELMAEGRRLYLGSFSSAIEAAEARRQYIIEHGLFNRTYA